MKLHLYRVSTTDGTTRRLVTAPNMARAVNHVSKTILFAERLDALEAVEAVRNGAEIEIVEIALPVVNEGAD